MAERYCPNCGDAYRVGFDECADCGVALVDEPPPVAVNEPLEPFEEQQLALVYRSGNRIDAELVRSALEGAGLDAEMRSSGLGQWRLEAALTEITKVPNSFNNYGVVVPLEQGDDALALLKDYETHPVTTDDGYDAGARKTGVLSALRRPWALAALFGGLLIVVVFGGQVTGN